MGHTLPINIIVHRKVIRNDFSDEWMNKMTDDEISQYEREVYDIVEKDPDTCYMSQHINRCILYKIFKMCERQLKLDRILEIKKAS